MIGRIFFILSPVLPVIFVCFSFQLQAGEADILDVKLSKTGERLYRLDVSVRHDDQGWVHFANRWEVVGPDGQILATRVLAHPHVREQPFTRFLGNIEIGEGLANVTVRAHDSLHGYGGMQKEVAVPQ